MPAGHVDAVSRVTVRSATDAAVGYSALQELEAADVMEQHCGLTRQVKLKVGIGVLHLLSGQLQSNDQGSLVLRACAVTEQHIAMNSDGLVMVTVNLGQIEHPTT